MAFDFPNSPTDGTAFSPAGGPTYIFSGGVWKISGGGGAFVVVSDAAPPSPYPGMLWFESDTGALFFWYVDADSSQWVQINFTPSGALTASPFKRTNIGASTNAFQFDASTLFADVEVQGGGGGGGGSGSGSGAGLGSAGGGGGGGGYSKKLIAVDATVRAATKTIVVGVGGNSSTVAGNNGTNSSYTDTINTLTGSAGSGGTSGVFANNISPHTGGNGGGGSGGEVNITGCPGDAGISWGSVNCGTNAAAAVGGTGGASGVGTGGARGGSSGAATGNANSTGGNGGAYGAGGGGGTAINAVAGSTSGGGGGDGVVIITEYR